MTQEYKTEEWKKWSSIYCSRCYKWLCNYKGWFKYELGIELFCKKCTEEIQQEQKTSVTNGISEDKK